MALILKDRISETTTTTGTGTITLGGANPGFQAFSSIGDANTTYYCVTSGAAWEVGLGTYSSSGNTLARTTVLANSNNNTSPITLGAGTKTVFSVYPADRAVVVDGTTIQIPNSAVLPVANGGTGSNTAAFSGANITDLNATAITAGTIANNRTTASSSNGASSIVQRDASGDFSANIITANSYSGSGASLTSLNASSISSGTLGATYGGTGQASLTANNVILGNGTSAVQFVAPGTSGNVLTSDGSTWLSQAAGGGGGSWTPVLSGSFTGSPTNITSFPSAEGVYMLVALAGFVSTAADQVWGIRVSFDGGSTYISTATAYWDPLASAVSSAYNCFRLFPSTSTTTRVVWGCYIYQTTLGGVPMTVINPASINTASTNPAGGLAYANGGYRLGTSTCSGIQLVRTTGSLNPIAGSKYVVYKMGAWS